MARGDRGNGVWIDCQRATRNMPASTVLALAVTAGCVFPDVKVTQTETTYTVRKDETSSHWSIPRAKFRLHVSGTLDQSDSYLEAEWEIERVQSALGTAVATVHETREMDPSAGDAYVTNVLLSLVVVGIPALIYTGVQSIRAIDQSERRSDEDVGIVLDTTASSDPIRRPARVIVDFIDAETQRSLTDGVGVLVDGKLQLTEGGSLRVPVSIPALLAAPGCSGKVMVQLVSELSSSVKGAYAADDVYRPEPGELLGDERGQRWPVVSRSVTSAALIPTPAFESFAVAVGAAEVDLLPLAIEYVRKHAVVRLNSDGLSLPMEWAEGLSHCPFFRDNDEWGLIAFRRRRCDAVVRAVRNHRITAEGDIPSYCAGVLSEETKEARHHIFCIGRLEERLKLLRDSRGIFRRAIEWADARSRDIDEMRAKSRTAGAVRALELPKGLKPLGNELGGDPPGRRESPIRSAT